jgi:hypothetical protein
MPRPSHPPWFHHPNIWWSVDVIKLLIMQNPYWDLNPDRAACRLSRPIQRTVCTWQCIYISFRPVMFAWNICRYDVRLIK